MTKSRHAPGYIPNDRFSQADWDDVSDNPDLTDEEIARLSPTHDVLLNLDQCETHQGRGETEGKAQLSVQPHENRVGALPSFQSGKSARKKRAPKRSKVRKLERSPNELNRLGFPNQVSSDSLSSAQDGGGRDGAFG